MTRTLCFGMPCTREDSSLYSVSSVTLVWLYQEIIVALVLPFKVAAIILGCILSMLFSDFRPLGPIREP